MSLKSRGAPFPLDTDPNDAAGWIEQLAGWVNDRPGIATVTTTQRNAIPFNELWTGRVVFNTTTKRLEYYDGAGWTGSISTPGRVLTSKEYKATLTASNNSGDDNITDVAAADLAVTFSAPASGVVWVDLEALVSWGMNVASATGATSYWLLRSGTAAAVAVAQMFGDGPRGKARGRARLRVGGLIPDQSYSWKWAQQALRATSDNSNTSINIFTNASSPASMIVTEG